MSRNVSSVFRQAAYAQQTDQIYLVCLEINHASLAQPIRVVNNYSNITSGGNEYIGFPFDIELPQDFEDALPNVNIAICNVDRQIVYAIRSLTGPPTITMFVVLASSPNTIEAGPYTMTLRSANYDAMAVSGTIVPEIVADEAFPGDYFTPGNFPGLF
jgi:hypothetical protein